MSGAILPAALEAARPPSFAARDSLGVSCGAASAGRLTDVTDLIEASGIAGPAAVRSAKMFCRHSAAKTELRGLVWVSVGPPTTYGSIYKLLGMQCKQRTFLAYGVFKNIDNRDADSAEVSVEMAACMDKSTRARALSRCF